MHLEIQYVGHPDILFTFHNLFKVKGKKWTFQVSVHRPNGSDQTATWNSQLGPKLESQYQAGNMNCGGQEKGTLPSQYCHKIMTLLLFRKITFL